MSPEDHARDILRFHYGTLSQSLQYPIRVVQLLYGEKVITNKTLNDVKTTTQSLSDKEAIFILLKAVRHAVRTNHHKLELFASVLLRFTRNVPCARAILKDCGEYTYFTLILLLSDILEKRFPNHDVFSKNQPSTTRVSEGIAY